MKVLQIPAKINEYSYNVAALGFSNCTQWRNFLKRKIAVAARERMNYILCIHEQAKQIAGEGKIICCACSQLTQRATIKEFLITHYQLTLQLAKHGGIQQPVTENCGVKS